VRAAVAALALAAAGCKGSSSSKVTAGSGSGSAGSAAPAVVDWGACDGALKKAASAPLLARPQIVIDGCHVCGDWAPILRWNTTHEQGGPTRVDIEAAMLRCNAWCSADAKQRFLGTLDKARGTSSRTPWRQLAEVCKDKVSAVPDQRFSSGPFFALDRIARAAAAHGGQTATLAAALELPLPAVSVVGTGMAMPMLTAGEATEASALAVTVLGGEVFVGHLPRAHLGANGVTVDMGPNGYPGTKVTVDQLRATLDGLAGDDRGIRITLMAPLATPAQSLVPIIAAAAAVAPVYLAVTARDAPEGWELPAAVGVSVDTQDPTLKLTGETSVQQLADLLAREAARGTKRVGVIAQ
jgi:hypothetical protein